MPHLVTLAAWLAALWLTAAVVMLVLTFWHPSVTLHWSTIVYLLATLVCSLIEFGMFVVDKYRAGTGGRRIPEVVLHTLELLGGWPGSLLAQRTFHHKNRKLAYQAVFWVIAGGHVVLLAWMAWLWWSLPSSRPEPAAAEPAVAAHARFTVPEWTTRLE